ncbi:dephospho-CoA kinase [Desulfallas sp. Bu1-1]|uniref:dephospho-CoA kinase n=1 Tax=Desulfallas sp. Bu1-1 TaxID=2787620 RepID=UPI00189D3A06|nr:dephospho-CoA kinase [Desulfallas sp. Bu1-1]MBF7084023.1 dephospho-CoA kinase [Desulfallas sp. Bu1-1]
MQAKRDWEKIIRRMELLLRLKSFPVAFKMLESKTELEKIPFLRRATKKVTLCQLITLVRNFDWTVGAELSDFLSPTCPSILGLTDIPEFYRDGTFRSIVWVKTREDAKKYEASIPRLPLGRYEAVAMAPLVYNPFEPDIVLFYANPAQMMLLINSLQFENYEVMHFHCVGESSCSDAIARCYLTGKPSLTIPCYGERRYGHAQDEDLVMAVPAGMMEKALRGMEALYRRGIRYPISYAGAEQDLTNAFPGSYGSLGQLEMIRGRDNRLLLGVTGGIATGKSTVVGMLREKGAPVIDFDLLAKKVVEPGQPAWKDIVTYFGEQILQEDRTLDRKKLADLVFRDIEKRKKLESFTHPRINEEFIKELNEIVSRDPNAIILVDIPLLIELNLQYMFHKLLVVYVPTELQIERLMKRDGINREEALNRLKAQLPIEEKVGYADFVINNAGSMEETQQQVDELWEKLKQIQKAKEA